MTDDDKSVEIRITAILKSIIESEAPVDEWEDRLRKGISLLCKVAIDHKDRLKKYKANSSSG